MISRGKYIGEIIDSISQLQNSIRLRSKLGFYDINKYCEDFACDLLNIVYGFNLGNLNADRVNEPGLDIGDKKRRVAYQVTSDKKLPKVSKTIDNITAQHKLDYDEFRILVLGEKQGSYTLTDAKYSALNFSESNIIDLNDIASQIVYLDIQKVEQVLKLFSDSMVNLLSEFELPDENGNYDTSYYNNVEEVATVTLNDINSFESYAEAECGELDEGKRLSNVKNLANELVALPRLSREVLAILLERKDDIPYDSESVGLELTAFQKILNVSDANYRNELSYLESKNMVARYEGDTGDFGQVHYVVLSGAFTVDLLCQELFSYAKSKSFSIRKMIVNLDFSDLS
ncbi:SMEK domain-containing protein [Vibrio parahaemolyticus]